LTKAVETCFPQATPMLSTSTGKCATTIRLQDKVGVPAEVRQNTVTRVLDAGGHFWMTLDASGRFLYDARCLRALFSTVKSSQVNDVERRRL